MTRLNRAAVEYLIAVAEDAGFELIGRSDEEFERTPPECSLTFRQTPAADPQPDPPMPAPESTAFSSNGEPEDPALTAQIEEQKRKQRERFATLDDAEL